MKTIFLFFAIFALFGSTSLFAQSSFKNIDYVYADYIKTVRLIPDAVSNLVRTFNKKSKTFSVRALNEIELMPILKLGTGQIELSFDDMEADAKFIKYKIEQRNADWSPTQLNDLEYIEGFTNYRLPDGGVFSFGNTTNYTHYKLTIPNENTKITKSGNYLLHVYLDDADETPLFTRRFLVIEQLAAVDANFVQTGLPEKALTHHELDFLVKLENVKTINPKSEFRAVVLQNGRWDNAKMNLKANFSREQALIFDYQDSIVFSGGQEFRSLDIRSLNFNKLRTKRIERFPDSYNVTLETDVLRFDDVFIFVEDINGAYIVDTQDVPQGEYDPHTQSEYANVLFTLKANAAFEDAEVYVVGKFADWQALPNCRMVYDEKSQQYVADISLKQGYYDYGYAVVKDGTTKLNTEEIDVNMYQTDNVYSIIVYHRAFGGRYDRIVSFSSFSSIKNRQ